MIGPKWGCIDKMPADQPSLKFEPNFQILLSLKFFHTVPFLVAQAIFFSNLYAPEHLIVNVRDAERWEGLIENAGTFYYLNKVQNILHTLKNMKYSCHACSHPYIISPANLIFKFF